MPSLAPSTRRVQLRRLVWLGAITAGALGLAVALLTTTPIAASAPAAAAQPVPTVAPAATTASRRIVGAPGSAAQYLQFEPNRGQAAKPVRYFSRGPRHHVEIFDDGIALASFHEGNGAATSARLSFAGIDAAGSFKASEPGPGVANYLTGSDAGTWIRAVPRYRQLRRADLYPGIDLVYYSRGGELEFDLVVKPGADPSRIRMEIGGATTPILAANGDLLLDGADGALRLHRPVLHQHIDGKKKTLDARFVLDGERRLRFALPAYDKRYPLVIDPVFKLLYSTYLTGVHDDQVAGMAVDGQGNAYVVGKSDSEDFVVTGNAVQTHKSTTGLQYNVVLTKFDPMGTIIYSTYLGGSGNDSGAAVAVDTAGRAYLTGQTTSRDFPVTPNADQAAFTGTTSAFLSVLAADGSALAYSTFYGGTGAVQAMAVALDAGGSAVLAGTASPGLRTTAGAYKTTLAAGQGAFVARFTPLATGAPRLAAASYYGVDMPQANSVSQGNTLFSMALDTGGSPWFTGQAHTTNLPLSAGALQSAPMAMSASCAAGPAPLNAFAYVARLSPDLRTLAYASYLSGQTMPAGGTACSEFGRAIAVDARGDVYVAGATGSAAFPTTAGALQAATPAGTGFASYASFIAKLRADGGALLWSTYFGGNVGNTFVGALAFDGGSGALWAAAVTSGGRNYPLSADALQRSHGGGGADAGLLQLDATSGALKFSSFLGGSAADVGLAVGADGAGNAFVAGNTFSLDFPLTGDAFAREFTPDFYGGADWFFSIVGNGAIARVSPSSGGNGGDVTLRVTGADLPAAGSPCALEAGAQRLVAGLVAAVRAGTELSCTFDLSGAAPGAYDLVVTRSDGSTLRRAAAFEVRPSVGGADLRISLVGRSTIRGGTPSSYQLTVTNTGDANAYAAMATLTLPASMSANVKFGALPPAFAGDTTDYAGSFVPNPSADGSTTRLIVFPVVRAGGSASLDLDLTAAAGSNEATVTASVCTSGPTTIEDWKAHAAAAKIRDSQQRKSRWIELARMAKPLTPAQSIRCFGSILSLAAGAVAAAASIETGGGAIIVGAAVGTLGGAITEAFASAAEGNALSMSDLTMQGAQSAAGAPLPPIAGKVFQLIDIGKNCDPDGSLVRGGVRWLTNRIRIRLAIDPNDKSGPTGDSLSAHYIASGPLTYQIAFENMASASLPAATVVVVDRLDLTKVDPATVTLGNIGFGTRNITVPSGRKSFATVQAIDATISVRIQGSVDVPTGVVKWTFTTLDPATGLPPSDPTLGFLPPDSDGVKGQSHVSFTVLPRSGLPDGVTVANDASIVFDANAPIATPAWVNVLDGTAPSSRVASLTGQPGTTSFDVAWAGADVVAGVASYSVYVSDNGGAYEPWQSHVQATRATYVGTSGHSYAFYAIAKDGAGNIEPGKTAAEATIAVNGAFADPTLGGSGSSGGGCTLGGDGRLDVGLPLLVVVAAVGLALAHRRSRRSAQPRGRVEQCIEGEVQHGGRQDAATQLAGLAVDE